MTVVDFTESWEQTQGWIGEELVSAAPSRSFFKELLGGGGGGERPGWCRDAPDPSAREAGRPQCWVIRAGRGDSSASSGPEGSGLPAPAGQTSSWKPSSERAL